MDRWRGEIRVAHPTCVWVKSEDEEEFEEENIILDSNISRKPEGFA